MDWMQIMQALFLGAMIVFLFPAAKNAFQNREQAFSGNWSAVLTPLAIVIIIVGLLILSVK